MKKTVFGVLWLCCLIALTACGSEKKIEDTNTEISEISLKESSDGLEGEKEEQENVFSKTASAKEKYPQIHQKGKVKSYGGTVTMGNSGYEIYNYVESSAKLYASVINKTADLLKGKAQVYDIIAPTSVGITFPDNKKQKINSTDQNTSIKKIYGKMNKKVTTISLYDKMMQHRDEYIYFRTDHHWTSRGAYYAYQAFCEAEGIQPNTLSEYKCENFGGYLGSFYVDSGKSKALKKDYVKAYYPITQKKTSMTVTENSGNVFRTGVICDGSNYGTSLKYCAFLAGDNPYTVIKNKKLKDGSSCLVIKESFGNAFVPYLTDHYQTIYVVDYRYWNGNITDCVKKHKVQDVIFMNNISMTRNAYLIGKMSQICK